ncbi:DinB family protein [Flavobacterium sp. XGLA_31]|uniref:DinB family protein n=1 Tax=Flavobacterium sp. XGLA_31 TaxID=3447666 RepID=UPI003F3F46F5
MQSEQLTESLLEQTRQILNQVEKLKNYDLHTLTWKENATSWSILECLEHLNLYGNFYLPQIENKIKSSTANFEAEFRSGILGNYFAKSMLPKQKLNTMKTFKDKNPLNAKLDKNVIDKFMNQQIKLLELLNNSRNVSLNKVKIQTSIASFIKLKLGDTFQFYINHIIRHLAQIDRIETAMKNA